VPSLKAISGLLLVSVALQVMFLDQAFHIDDDLFLMIARNRSAHPWFPQDLSTYFEGLRVDGFVSHEHPLLLSSLLLDVALRCPVRYQEIAAHSIFLVFYLLLVLAAYSLAARFLRHPALAALLIAVSPIVFVSSHTVMLDLPFVALLYAALAAAVFSRERPELGYLAYLAAVLSAAAVMLAYQALLFVPLLWVAAGNRCRSNLILALPLVALLGYGLLNSLYFGRFIWSDTVLFWLQQPPSGGGFLGKLASSSLAFLGVVVFPVSWVIVGFGKRVSVDTGLAVNQSRQEGQLSSNPVATYLVAMLILNVVMIVFACQVGAARYLLPGAPAACLLFARLAESRFSHRAGTALLLLTIGLGGYLSWKLARADYEWAGFYRQSSVLMTEYRRAGTRVWITGEWGFRWYFTQAGAEVLGRADGRAKPGDILIRPRIASPYRTLYDVSPMALELLETVTFRPDTAVRLLDFDSHAGFYSSGWGLLPYSLDFQGKPLELIAVYRVAEPAPPPGRQPTYWDWNKR